MAIKATFILFSEWAIEICKIFNLDPSKVRSIDLHIAVGSIVTINIEHLVMEEDVPKLIQLLGKLTIINEDELEEV